MASKLEVLPGAEFRVAYEEAMSYGARVILGDRPVQVHLLSCPSSFLIIQSTKSLGGYFGLFIHVTVLCA